MFYNIEKGGFIKSIGCGMNMQKGVLMKMDQKTIIVLAIIIIIIAAIVLLVCNVIREKNMTDYITLTPKEAKEMMDLERGIFILDVRTKEEYEIGHIPDAILLPYDSLEKTAEKNIPDKTSTVLVYCRSGKRSALAASTLSSLGYTNVYDFGGINEWDYGIIVE